MESIKHIVTQVLDNLGMEKKVRESRAISCWKEIVGERIASNTHPYKIQKGILFVSTSSPVWSQELSLLSREIKERINSLLGEDVIKEMRFYPRGVDRQPVDQAPSREIAPRELNKAQAQEIEELASQIGDDVLRERFKKVLARAKAREDEGRL
ncbi:hypothetical protein HKBW3S44_00623 [Candidatus Hakubella thermalkaliphila]|uniref:DUF721 domain-containing protein n=1 Tax=Candidatus Hakubella thermalkaliphila TaxID=2754717 RepID=A0A6V8Q2X3_9ACTN|nr:DUF721 domain-containing protein [Candidatus Hakubella thermalkaliphila]GFP30599.1 hypothetical protein HKBW3S34_01519 [Candidatus Hakubella thermalkaliphila]GFP36942.1 hypothetical protein HKBW3S44_00623 [Candidatus Hakubella thermalkaliphila]GFP38790.1 hypothetical protein HKBW3S47_00491 [Candidatus Hakubella thermalkaliphila]